MKIFFCVLFVLCFACASFAQKKIVEKQYEFKGVLKDKDSAVFAGATLFFNNNGKENFVSTDINGKFSINLSPGNYEVTVEKTLSETFKAYVFIQENGLNPQNVEFIIEPNPVCCGTSSEKPYPKIVKIQKPPYPAAARAVGAAGEVVVEVKFDKEGKVISAKAVSGHPLLRSASVQAARQSLFEASENDEQREVKLTFIFLPNPNGKENKKRYSNPYRIEVIAEIFMIDSTQFR